MSFMLLFNPPSKKKKIIIIMYYNITNAFILFLWY